MTTELKLLETVALPYEAEQLQQMLEAAGIDAFIEGVNGSNAFGMNALMGSIKIKVRPEDLPRARQALSESLNRVGGPWYCGSCHEQNEASFEICWQCGGDRSEVEAAPPQPTSAENLVRPEDLLSPRPANAEYNPAPYAPPTSELALPAPASINSAVQAEYEDTIERAYRASILGLVTLPGVLHIYSFVLLLGALSLPATTTDARQSLRFTTAMTINLVVFLFIGGLVFFIVRRS